MSGPPPALDETSQYPTRLTVLGFLSGCLEAEFAAVRDYARISDASVCDHVTVVATVEAGSFLLVELASACNSF
ncbi:hypothetical protein [Nonomuraea zeae]|uniref:hypothetical protein n=1 Tax=Nonomuraea zeae TaxID=1642303 RepID=UPI0019822E2A|nr:hypothetical protein [Nonomuraea zeae]